jgi:glyoxylate reductase
VAKRARAFGFELNYHDRQRSRLEVEDALELVWWESLDQMLARMDIVTVHVPHTPATFHLLSARRLELLKPEAWLINTARGEIVDENALTRMLLAGRLAGAGLDVFEREPAVNPRLLGLPNVILLPHMASATLEGRLEMGEKVILNVKTFIDGHRPPDQILPSML